MAKGRLSGIMASLFGGGRKESKGGGTSSGSGDDAFRPQREVEQAEVLRQDQGLFGKVYILSLVEFYDAIGGRSGRLAESLLIICDTVFQERMGPNDGFSPVGDDQYVFRFGGLDDRQSLIQAAKIIEEIGTKLLGEHFIKSGRFKAMLTAVGIGDIVDADGEVDAGKIATAVDLARQLPPEPSAPEDPVWVRLNYAGVADGDKWVAVPSSKRDSIQWAALDYKPAKKEVRWEAIEPPKKKKDDDLQWEVLRREKKAEEIRWQTLERKKKADSVSWQALRVERPN